MGSLPVAAVLATWLDAFRAGDVGPDDLADAVRGDDPRHLVTGLTEGDALELHELPALLEGGAGEVLAFLWNRPVYPPLQRAGDVGLWDTWADLVQIH